MHRLVPILLLIPFACAAAKDPGGDLDACQKGRTELASKVAVFQGPDRIKRLIEADLSRAGKEEAEGDLDECIEALDHAAKLIAGQY